MKYIYGEFTESQIQQVSKKLHSQIHKLLLHKDPHVTDIIFENDDAFNHYYQKLLLKLGGLNSLFGEPYEMVLLMATLEAAYDETKCQLYDYDLYRSLILDAHNLLSSFLREV